ncbi:dipeptidyl-peptidase-3 [Prolixibacter denitrificans]|uniref:Dihydrofolate reductase n=2 Tax=Prolixibacter denitrificans TaxID=1541063 RepID=A0A2P8C8W5_9BACT|nr:dipeptidyl-peptidase-3 [Prolixibacter denitrificans]GET21124.1 dihydrofolate reductase [Prolixibacter denitrificans]
MVMSDNFKFFSEKFADLKILRYQVDGFEQLTLEQKRLIYYLSRAALAGRDILWDQNNEYNLRLRKVLETIYQTFDGDRKTKEFKQFEVYLKRIWFSNGMHHHYSMDKILPDFSQKYFLHLIGRSNWSDFEHPQKLIHELLPIIFDPGLESKRVSLDSSKDLLLESANNFYKDVTQAEAELFYAQLNSNASENPPSFGLNSKLVMENGELVEKKWKENGLYSEAIQEIVKWLQKAQEVAESPAQKRSIAKLIIFYQTGDLKSFDEHSIEWVKDIESQVDFVNGFIEVYGDALGIKGSWESIVNFKDEEATRRTEIISNNAQWFEDHSPVSTEFKKEKVTGVSAKVITVAMLGGDCHPATPIGINLPNAEWIREQYGSKSVTIENITYAYHQASLGDGMLEEFCWDKEEIERARKHGYLGNNLHTDLHECLGHGSGRMKKGVTVDALKNYYSTLEETRADLFALYFIMDPKLVELGLTESDETAKAEYDGYIRNGLLTQLVRIETGKDLEESHMRNRQLIARWVYDKGSSENVIERKERNDKTFFVINDYQRLRELFGELLKEVQRIKSEGDYEAGKALVENYGVKVIRDLHDEVLERYKKLNLAPYAGFLNPDYEVIEEDGEIKDIRISYPENFAKQMLDYSKHHSFLPIVN